MDQAGNQSALFDYYGKSSFSQASLLAIQHMVAAIVGRVTPATIVSETAGLDPTDKAPLIRAALVVAGLTTLLQLFPIDGRNGLHIGVAPPVVMGVSFAHVPSMQAIAGREGGPGAPMILGAQVVGGVAAIIVSFSVKKIRKLPLPLTAGTVVFTIGLSLHSTVANYMAGGAGKPLASRVGKLGFGSQQNWTTTLVTLAVVTVLNHCTKGILKLASILVGAVVGYVVTPGFGLVDFSDVASAGLFQFPTPLHFGAAFDPSSCVAVSLLSTISSIQAIGDFSATATDLMDRMPGDRELQGGIVGYGISNIIGTVLGGLPTTTYSQNIGVVITTEVANRIVLGMAVVTLPVVGLVPKFLAVLAIIPQYVLDGATITIFASTAMTGVKLVMTEGMNYRNTSIVGLFVTLGMGVTQVASPLVAFLDWATVIFDEPPVAVATRVAILLNVVLPRENTAAKKN